MARPLPPVSPCVPWPCSGTSTPTGLVRAAPTRLVARRSTTSMASSITPTGSTICSSPPPWEGENYEPRNPMESGQLQHHLDKAQRLKECKVAPSVHNNMRALGAQLLKGQCLTRLVGKSCPPLRVGK